ncbi:10516_t:CDS:1, partial [Gigaspora rosea]
MVESPIMVESPVIVESPLMVESPTIVESPMVESSMEEENQTGENSILRDTLRKRKSRKNESHEQCEARLDRDRERKWQKRAKDKLHRVEKGLEEFEANLTDDSNRDFQSEIDIDMNEPDIPLPLPSTILDEYDKVLLHQFRNKMDKLKHSECPTCKECFPSITLVVGECRRCYTEKTLPKKFSFDNNMDPGEVPEELQKLTEIEEMLIAQVFSVMVVYKLRKGQHRYRGNIINFPQDVEEFTTRLPWHPSSLNVLIICWQSDKDPTAFRDFKIHRNKVACALCWLKANNNYYSEITIDNENLQSLLEDGFIDDQLQVNQLIDDKFNEDNEENGITHTFVPYLPSDNREEIAINNTINRLLANNTIEWPKINNNPINEFQTSGYIA